LDLVHFGLPGSIAIPGVQARAFSDIKDNYFGTTNKRARELAFRYVVLADFSQLLKDSAGNSISGNVAAVTATTFTSTTALPALPASSPHYRGHVVMITAGTGAGQVRNIVGQPAANQLRVAQWSVTPDATSQFLILSGSSGKGETDWYASPDNYSVPGNDFVVSMGGFGVNAGILSNSFFTGRTIVHELGHTLGLRHGGVDHQTRNPNYLSLMSYAHQNIPGSPVNSYAGAGDVVFDDWANLKPGFQNTLVHVGNTFGLGLGDTATVDQEPEVTVADVEDLIGGPLDFEGPALSIQSPGLNATVEVNGAFAVELNAADVTGVHSVQVRFDINGDGDTEDAGETVFAAPGTAGAYKASFDGIAGPVGVRSLQVVAVDVLGNFSIEDRSIEVVDAQDPLGPEVGVTGKGLAIVSGSVVPALADATSFGSVDRDQPRPSRTYTVKNTGAAPLTLGSVNVPNGFALVEPLTATLATGGSDSFTVELNTATVGVFGGDISFSTNDLNENPFHFAVSGEVLEPAPEIEVSGNGILILDGAASATPSNHTDFGKAGQFTAGTNHTFTVRNTRTAPLTLGPLSLPAGFTLVEPLATSLAAGESDTFTIQLDSRLLGTFSGQVSFATNDPDENPFDFTIAGAVVIQPGSLDLTFGAGDGWVKSEFGVSPQFRSIVVQPDEKILVGGVGGHIAAGFTLGRYLPNGDVDTTFGGGDGIETTDFG
jgi:hypothetical protein